MVVNDVEDDFQPGSVESLDHGFELRDLAAAVAGRAVVAVRGEEADAVVAPVVAQALFLQVAVLYELVHRQQFDGGHAKVCEVLDGCGVRQAGVTSADVLGDVRVLLREALDVDFVDHSLGERGARRDVGGTRVPIKGRVRDHAAGRRSGGVRGVELGRVIHIVGKDSLAPVIAALDRGGVGVQQQLVDVVPQPGVGIPGAVDADAVPGADFDSGDHAVEHVSGPLRQHSAGLCTVAVEGADFHGVGALGVNGHVRATVPQRDAQRIRKGTPGSGRSHTMLVSLRSCQPSIVSTLTNYRIGRGCRLPAGRARRSPAERGPAAGSHLTAGH